MTEAELDQSTGALIRRYEANLKTIACLTSDLQHIGEELKSLGSSLVSPKFLTPDAAQDKLDTANSTVGKLNELREAIARKNLMDGCLRQAGLERLIDKA
ncbi:MAG: hypothetical protein F4X72_05905 [Dehalococcoidia bacterium]|nr:hypothetical protein [Dehalococcoidia bacterium]